MDRITPTDPPSDENDAGAAPWFVWDADRRRIVDANADGVAFWGEASLIDLLDRPFAPEGVTAASLDAALQSVASGGVRRMTLALRTATAIRTVIADVSDAPLTDGRIGLRIDIAGDATETDETSPRLAELARHLDVPAALFSSEGDLIAKNEAARLLVPDDIASLSALLGEDGATRRLMGQALGDGLASATFRIASRFGPRLARVTLTRARDPQTGGAAVAASLHDIADRARVTARPHATADGGERDDGGAAPAENGAAASAAARALLSRVGHELKTPLNAILGFAEIMADERFGPIGDPKYAEYARDIHVGGEHLLGLVNDLLDLARSENGRRSLDFEAVDLGALAHETVDLLRGEAEARNLALEVAVADGVPPVVADKRTLRQITINLIGNAIKFTDGGGSVTLGVLQGPEGEVILSVADTGIGMTAEEVKAALEPFGQVERAQSGRVRGVGLGLPLSRSLAEANKASFAVDSEPGKGTLVRVTFAPTSVLAT